MITQVIYDNEGVLLAVNTSQTITRNPVGVPFINCEVPAGKRIVGVDVSVTPHQVILEDIPPNEIDILRAENKQLSDTVEMILVDILPTLMP